MTMALRGALAALLVAGLSTGLAAGAPGTRRRFVQPADAVEAFHGLDLAGPCNVDKRHDLTYAEFQSQYRGRKPVVLGGASWAAARNFTAHDFADVVARYAEYPVPVYHPFGIAFVGVHVRKLAGAYTSKAAVGESRAKSPVTHRGQAA
jgi:hypothetical protein